MDRFGDPRDRFLCGTEKTTETTPTHGVVRTTPSTNPLTCRFGRRGQPSRIVGSQDYCKVRDLHEEVFKMAQKEDESLEDYVERFHYNVKRAKQNHLELETIKIILLRGIRDDCIDLLNLTSHGYVSQLTYP
jgi:hypothetical protein